MEKFILNWSRFSFITSTQRYIYLVGTIMVLSFKVVYNGPITECGENARNQ
jgi:hypothetical protein